MNRYIRNAQGPQIYSTPTTYIDMSSIPLQDIKLLYKEKPSVKNGYRKISGHPPRFTR